jgi:glycosyltransferase involved in cell wall biosynthesis
MTLYIVIPCYNEEAVLNEVKKRLTEKLSKLKENQLISDNSRVMFVDDGSRDKTWEIISGFAKEDKSFCAVKLTRNRGHQYALLAGLMTAKNYADCVISMDADLQDDIDAVDKFIEKYNDGCEIVYGVRSQRKTDTAFKRNTAQWYYKILEKLGVEIVYNHADYRLMSKRALDELEKYDEANLFLRGIIPQIGFKWDVVTYERFERFAGESKYPLKKMLALAVDGITSFSVKPINVILSSGVFLTALSSIALIVMLILSLVLEYGFYFYWILPALFLATGITLISLGIVGEYIGKIYKEVKHRPRYIIETVEMKND